MVKSSTSENGTVSKRLVNGLKRATVWAIQINPLHLKQPPSKTVGGVQQPPVVFVFLLINDIKKVV